MEERKTSRARERQRRRRERRQTTHKTTSIPRQLTPEGSLSLSDIDLRWLRYGLLAVAALAFMGVTILAVGLFTNDPVEPDPNALWVGTDWTYQVHDDDAIRDFVRHLRDHEIATIYAQVSDLNFDGSWTGRPDLQNQFEEVRPEVTQFSAQLKEHYPEATLYGVLGIRADLAGDNYRLDDERVQRVVADFSNQVVGSLGYDGVLLNVEPVWDGDENFLDLLRRVRREVADSALLAVAVPPDWTPENVDIPTPAVIAPGTVWTEEYKQRVALIRPDQIVLRTYNSYLNDANDYAAWLAYQVQAFAEVIAPLQIDTQIIVGVPTYDNELPAHDVAVENMVSALLGVRRGLMALDETTLLAVEGVAVFADWSTDATEWGQFRDHWVNRN